MTNFFGLRRIRGQENAQLDGDAFLAWELSPEQETQLEEMAAPAARLYKEFRLPGPLKLLKNISLLLWIAVLGGMIRGGMNLKFHFARMYQNAPGAFWAFAAALLVWLVLRLYESSLQKSMLDSQALATLRETAERMERQVRQALNIPENALKMDALLEEYTLKSNGEPKRNTLYVNRPIRAFREGDALCLADSVRVWAIPFSALTKMEWVKKRAVCAGWHKEESKGEYPYKAFVSRQNQYGHYACKCFRVEIHAPQGDYFLLLPGYEQEASSSLTGLYPEDDIAE